MRKYSKSRATLGLLIILLTVVFSAPFSFAADPETFTSDSVVYGRTLSEWSAEWWQWALSIPVDNHPLFDTGDSSVGQSGPVWFLGGKFCNALQGPCDASQVVAERNATIPYGKAILLAVVNTEDSVLEGPRTNINGKPLAGDYTDPMVGMRQYTQGVIDGTDDLLVEVDGKPIKNLKELFRVQSPVFSYTLPSNNLFNAIGEGPYPAGSYFPSVGDGIYVMLKPLPRGSHVVHLKGAFKQFNFTLDITYNITVE